MPQPMTNSVRFSWQVLVAGLIALPLLGCGAPRYPVEGRVLVEGKQLTGKEGTVVLKPDDSKGNQSTAAGVGVLDRDGGFKIATNGQPGVVAGWYKVIIVATEPGANPNEDSRRVLNSRYEKEATTPLAIEVVADRSEGYDLNLSR